jgi:hypothetical protein
MVTLNESKVIIIASLKLTAPIPVVCRRWGCGFESRWGHGCLCLVNAVRCHVEVSATGRSKTTRCTEEHSTSCNDFDVLSVGSAFKPLPGLICSCTQIFGCYCSQAKKTSSVYLPSYYSAMVLPFEILTAF